MTSACRPLTAWRHLAALLCTAAIFAPGPAGAQPCTTCARTSLGLAPRSYAAGDMPVAAAAGDLNGDGRGDLVVANNPGAGKIRVLLGGPNGFVVAGSYDQSPVPRGVAIADFDTDGLPDVVVAAGDAGSGWVRIHRNLGNGNLSLTPIVSRSAGLNTSAVVVGDFDGNGTPDVAAASQDTKEVFVFLGDGKGGLDSGHFTSVGKAPRALVAGFFDADGILDLAVACSSDNQVRVLLGKDGGNGKGNGTFTAGPILDVGAEPVSIAAADLEPDGDLDIVTANKASDTVSVLRNQGAGTFGAATTYPVDDQPNGVALLQVDANPRPDIVTSNFGNQSVNLLLDNGPSAFKAATRHYVRSSPQAVVPVDVDADGQLDIAVPCRGSAAVVVLAARPPAFSAAARYTVGSQPVAAVAVDLDGDTHLDLAVANQASSTVSILLNTSAGSFVTSGTFTVASTPSAIVAGDFNHDGIQDLAVSSAGTNQVSVLRGKGGGDFEDFVGVAAGSSPSDIAAGDVNGDGYLDLLVCNGVSPGTVALLANTQSASIGFALPVTFAVGQNPTSIFAGHLNGDLFLDFAVANDTGATLTVRYGNGGGDFPDAQARTLNLTGGDANPTSVTGADFDKDGDIDLAATVLIGSAVSVFPNSGSAFATTPFRIPAADFAVHAAAADINLDGKIDLAVAAAGLEVLRGQGSVTSFEAAEDFVAGRKPVRVVVADFSGDSRPDVAVVNRDSDDVSILLGTGCTARRLEVIEQPAQSCITGPAPYPGLQAVVETRDDGGNLACPVGDVTAAIVPGTGTTGATLTGAGSPPSVPLSSGVASFTTSYLASLTIDKTGKRYRLQFALPSQPQVRPVVSDTFTLGAQPAILGPTSFCPGAQATYEADPAEGPYDQYMWTLDGAPTPFAYTPSILLGNPPLSGERSYNLTLGVRIDSCALSTSRTIWYREWLSTTLSPLGPTTVCVDCLGGTVSPADVGGGAVVSRQWGYRTASGPAEPVTPIPSETAGTYVVKGTDFPGPGTYYLVVTTGFTCPSSPSVSAELPIVVSAVVQSSEVKSLAVTSRGSGASRENLLQWVNSSGSATEICIRWNQVPDGTPCTFPVVPDCQTGSNWHQILSPTGELGSWPHTGVALNTNYCYAVFVRDGPWSPGRVVKARAFDADAGPVKWAYSTGATAVVPPVVGQNGILVMSNDRTVHSLRRGSTGGVWPALWTPHTITGVANSRSPVVPFSVPVNGADSALLVGDDAGDIQAVNVKNGKPVWGPVTPSANATITGAPGAILQQWGGVQDLLLVGTRNKVSSNPSEFFGLILSTGAVDVPAFNGGGTLGPINGTPAVDYATQRVYFASRSYLGGPTLWCVQVSASAPALSAAAVWSRNLGDVDGSPVLRNGRVYVGANSGIVYSLNAATGGDDRTFSPGDGPVKGFLFPDRRNDNLIFATSTKVWSVSDATGTFGTNWTWKMPAGSPSIVLYWPQTNYVYVGGGNGKLWQLNFTYLPGDAEFAKSWTLGDGFGQIGAPTLDIGVAPPDVSAGKKLLIVGSESGVLYGVEVPLP